MRTLSLSHTSHDECMCMCVQVDEPISAEDYFKKNPEFRVWLAESKGKKFGDLCVCVRVRACVSICIDIDILRHSAYIFIYSYR
jgi:hypothetical protein